MIAFVPPSGKKFEILGSWPMNYLDSISLDVNIERLENWEVFHLYGFCKCEIWQL